MDFPHDFNFSNIYIVINGTNIQLKGKLKKFYMIWYVWDFIAVDNVEKYFTRVAWDEL